MCQTLKNRTTCTNSACAYKVAKWEKSQSTYARTAKEQLQKLRNKLQLREWKMIYSQHYFQNLHKREYSVEDVQNALLFGRVVERIKDKDTKFISLVILYYTDSKPMHVVVENIDSTTYLLKTVYNPMAHYWKWNNTYDKRICFCN